MAERQVVYRCLIISPSDVVDARDALEQVINEWNAHVGRALGARVEAVRWETHATPEMGGRPQGILNEQLVDSCDLGVAVFWSRLGTPTGEHESGSVEELERLLNRHARVLVYFCTANIPQAAMSDDQFPRLAKAREAFESRGLLGTYSSPEQLARTFLLHLTSTMTSLLLQGEASAQPIPSVGTATAPRPDVRVRMTAAHMFSPRSSGTRYVQLTVENHSPSDFFLQSVYFRLDRGGTLWPQVDSATGQRNEPRTIRPGDSVSFFFDPVPLIAQATEAGAKITHAMAKDKISREYLSPDGDAERVLR